MSVGLYGIGSGKGIGESYDVASKTYTMDVVIGIRSETFTMDVHLRDLSKVYLVMDVLNFKTVDIQITPDLLALKRNINLGIPFTSYFTNPVSTYTATLRIITDYRNRKPTDSIINTLYWSWATVLDQSYRDITNAGHSINLQKADTTDLDIIGEVYHLRRLVGETDDNYRKRLSTQTSVLIGHGTKASCEAIIDQVTGVVGCNIITGTPGTIKITFDNDIAMRSAFSLRDTIEFIIPDMIAAGITWTFYTPICDLPITMALLGADECPYTMNIYNEMYHDFTFIMDIINIFMNDKSITLDILNKKPVDKTYEINSYISKQIDMNYIFDILNSVLKEHIYTVSCLNRKRNLTTTYSMDNMIFKENIEKTYQMDELSKKGRTSRYSMGVSIV